MSRVSILPPSHKATEDRRVLGLINPQHSAIAKAVADRKIGKITAEIVRPVFNEIL